MKIADCSDDLTNPTPLLEALLHLTAKALSLTANLYTFCRVVGLVESLVKVAHNPFFLQNNNMCEVLCYELFLVTNHGNENIRSRASKLVFFLMQVQKESRESVKRVFNSKCILSYLILSPEKLGRDKQHSENKGPSNYCYFKTGGSRKITSKHYSTPIYRCKQFYYIGLQRVSSEHDRIDGARKGATWGRRSQTGSGRRDSHQNFKLGERHGKAC
jgi:hypothetical protein